MTKTIPLTKPALIAEELADVQHRMRARIVTPEMIADAVREAEERLVSAGIPKKYWKDVTISYAPYQNTGYGKNWTNPMATRVAIIRQSANWAVSGIGRYYVSRGSKELIVTLTVSSEEFGSGLIRSILAKHDISVAARLKGSPE